MFSFLLQATPTTEFILLANFLDSIVQVAEDCGIGQNDLRRKLV